MADDKVGFSRGMASRHRRYDRRLRDAVSRQDPALAGNLATPQARRLYEMGNAVSRCLHAKKGFLRMNVSPGGVLYAKTTLEHHVLDLLAAHFHRRFPGYHIAIESGGRTMTASPSGVFAVHDCSVMDAVKLLDGGAQPSREEAGRARRLWEEYYDSQDISSRRNLRLMRKMMPARYMDPDAYESRKASGSGSISDWL